MFCKSISGSNKNVSSEHMFSLLLGLDLCVVCIAYKYLYINNIFLIGKAVGFHNVYRFLSSNFSYKLGCVMSLLEFFRCI